MGSSKKKPRFVAGAVEPSVSDRDNHKPGAPVSANPYAEVHAKALADDRKSVRSLQRFLKPGSKEWRQCQRKIDAIDHQSVERADQFQLAGEGSSRNKLKRVRRNKRDRKVPLRSTPKAVQPADVQPAGPRDAIEVFREKVRKATGNKIKRKDIWAVAGYQDATEFQRFQREDPRTTEKARAAFNHVLNMKPEDFIRKLQTK